MSNLLALIFLLGSVVAEEPTKLIKVAVIDTGYDFHSDWKRFVGKRKTPVGTKIRKPKLCKTGHKDFTTNKNDKNYLKDIHGHGTHVAGIIAQYAHRSNYCLVILKFYPAKKGGPNLNNSILAMKHAIKIGVDVINYSAGGSELYLSEYRVIQEALKKNIVVVAAAGNDGNTTDHVVAGFTKKKRPFYFNYLRGKYVFTKPKKAYYPAGLDSRIIAVKSINKNGNLAKTSNRGLAYQYSEIGVRVLSIMPNNKIGFYNGTSQATAVKTGKVIKNWISR